MTVKSIIFIFYRRKLLVTFFVSLSVHLLIILFCIYFGRGEVTSNRFVDTSIQLSLVSENEKGSDVPLRISKNAPTESETVSSKQTRLPSELNDVHRDNSYTANADSIRLSDATPYVGGLFTRHLRKSTPQQTRNSSDVDVERNQRNAYRLAVFSLLLSKADSVICVLRDNNIECEDGYEMAADKAQEWLYLYAQQLLPNEIGMKRDYLVKTTELKH